MCAPALSTQPSEMNRQLHIAPAPAARSNAPPPVYSPLQPISHAPPPPVQPPSRFGYIAPGLARRLTPLMYEFIRYQDKRNFKANESRAHFNRAFSKILYQHEFSTILERILLHLQDMPSILRCTRVSRVFKSTIFRSDHLQRALWILAIPPNINLTPSIHFLTPSSVVDPLITYLRTELDLFIRFQVSKRQYNVLCCPTTATQQFTGIALTARLAYRRQTWKSMLVMRAAETEMRWVVGYQAQGTYWEANLGFRTTAPTFADVMDCVTHMERWANGQGRGY